MGFTVSFSSEVWKRKLTLYLALVGKTIHQGLSEEWPLLMRKVIDFTPPFKTRGAVKASGENFGASDYSVGRKATATDIYKTMRPFDPKDIKTKGMMKIVANKDIAAFNIVAARSGRSFMNGARAVAFSPAYHLDARNSRGRVPGGSRNQVVLGSDVPLLHNYVKTVLSHVGVAKGGWAPAYNLVRSPDGWQLPDWVERQGGYRGSVIDDRDNADNPSITAINSTPWAVRKDEGERIKTDAYASRAEALRTKFKVALRLARDGSGFSGQDAA